MHGSLYFAVGSLVVPFAISALMAMYPNFRLLGWAAIAICGGVFAASTASYLAQLLPHHFDTNGLRNYFIGFCGGSGVLLVIAAMLFFDHSVYRALAPEDKPLPIKTGIRLQFFGDVRIPHVISSDNVATWFAYFTPSISMVPKDTDGKTIAGGFEVPPNWAIFVAIDKAASFKQVLVEFSNTDLMPVIDIQQSSSRAILISTRGLIPAGVLNIHAVS
ncbi:MAG TPA: hypothetical protein VJ476_15335 [Rhizomicrobium sp.]|nr:hypothetical protein [Rhizomicrobium sp.]